MKNAIRPVVAIASTLMVFATSQDARATDIIEEPLARVKGSIGAVKRTITSWPNVDLGGVKCTFFRSGKLTCCGKKPGEATWSLNKFGHLKSSDNIQGCRPSYYLWFEIEAYSPSALDVFVQNMGPVSEKGFTLISRSVGTIRKTEDSDGFAFVKGESTLGIAPGSKDRTLFTKTVEQVRGLDLATDRGSFVGFLARSPKGAKREALKSSIRYSEHYEKEAKTLADALRGTLGDVEVGSQHDDDLAYDVLLVVGKDRYEQPPLRVQLTDGVCTKEAPADCSNEFLAEIEAIIKDLDGFVVAGTNKASNSRKQDLEVWAVDQKWFERSEELVKRVLAKLKPSKPSTWFPRPKEWKWGGEFDVVLVVGPKTGR